MVNREKICVIGLGYVGLPLALELAKEFRIIGYDTDITKVTNYLNKVDPSGEVNFGNFDIANIHFTSDEKEIIGATFYIVTVPTPIYSDKTPDLTVLTAATKVVGKSMEKGAVIVYESTVYPGTTEEICVPLLEEISGLKLGQDFKVGYSPERINPGDKNRTLRNIVKVVSASDNEALERIFEVYNKVIDAGIYKAQSIKVAEAAKVIENSQRDVNIAFMNEITKVLNRMDINISDVLEAARTKWNFIDFKPGLVGGHCIGVDPYYFLYKAEQLGYHSELINASRRINDDMHNFIVNLLIKKLLKSNINVQNLKVGILGITFKEDCKDIRNTKIVDMYKELIDYGFLTSIYDPIADWEEVYKTYEIKLTTMDQILSNDLLILAVPHQELINNQEFKEKVFKSKIKVIFDLKGSFKDIFINQDDIIYWTL